MSAKRDGSSYVFTSSRNHSQRIRESCGECPFISVIEREDRQTDRERESRKNKKISMHLFDAGTYSRHENSEWVIKLDDF